MITFEELKERTTPDIIKKMAELAEGFELDTDGDNIGIKDPFGNFYYFEDDIPKNMETFPLLLHRAVEGWNKLKHEEIFMEIVVYKDKVCLENYKLETHNNFEDYYKYILIDKNFKNYQPKSLTQAECAMLDCLLDVFKQEERDDFRYCVQEKF